MSTDPNRESTLRDLAELETAAGLLRRMITEGSAGDPAREVAGRILHLAGEVAVDCDPGHHEGHWEVAVQAVPGDTFEAGAVRNPHPDAGAAGEVARKVQETGAFHCVRVRRVITTWFTPEGLEAAR